MARHDWYRNESWDDATEVAFVTRLRRARNKPQYLRIQASYLTSSHPEAALKLLEQYFALGDHFDHAQAHVERAKANLALGDIRTAVTAYEAALAREAQFPKVQTQAYLDLSVLIAERRLKDLYPRALSILSASQSRPIFPLERYLWHGARALMLHEEGKAADAKAAATVALLAVSEKESGFRNHPRLGLVQRRDDDFGRRVASIAGQHVAVTRPDEPPSVRS